MQLVLPPAFALTSTVAALPFAAAGATTVHVVVDVHSTELAALLPNLKTVLVPTSNSLPVTGPS